MRMFCGPLPKTCIMDIMASVTNACLCSGICRIWRKARELGPAPILNRDFQCGFCDNSFIKGVCRPPIVRLDGRVVPPQSASMPYRRTTMRVPTSPQGATAMVSPSWTESTVPGHPDTRTARPTTGGEQREFFSCCDTDAETVTRQAMQNDGRILRLARAPKFP